MPTAVSRCPTGYHVQTQPGTVKFGKIQKMISTLVLLLSNAYLTVADVNALSEEDYALKRQFRLKGTVVSKSGCGCIFFKDKTGRTALANVAHNSVRLGDTIDIGLIARNNKVGHHSLVSTGQKVIGHEDLGAPPRATITQVVLGEFDYRNAVVEGLVTEAFTDEIDPLGRFIVLTAGGYSLTVNTGYGDSGLTNETSLVGARVRVTGAVSPTPGCWRHFMERSMSILGEGLGLSVSERAPADVFDAPSLCVPAMADPRELADMGLRRVTGRVRAVWQDSRFLLDGGRAGRPLVISCTKGIRPPQYGNWVTVVGFPTSDFFSLIVSQAHWKPAPEHPDAVPEQEAVVLSARKILCDAKGRQQYQAPYYGQLLTLRGIVRNIVASSPSDIRFHLDCDGFDIPVDVSARPDAVDLIGIGYEVSVTGVCLMDINPWRPNAPFPHITGVTLVIRTPEDIAVTARPSWWTPQRLLGLVVGLLAVLVGFIIWNRFLNHLVNRRSRQLLKEQVARASADLRVGERTRLAVELHDSLSQNLAGVACQITATKRAMALHPDQALPSLEKAERMLLSSRTELKRCLWDLRSDALEESDTSAAISKTLGPVLGNAKLVLRFSVPRNRLKDSTMHAILCILRELCSNSVRHGQANTLRIAGALDGNALVFSVADDGHGFDVTHVPGPESGHFGLAGIRERVEHLGGSVEMRSNPPTGTYTRIGLPLIRPNAQEKHP